MEPSLLNKYLRKQRKSFKCINSLYCIVSERSSICKMMNKHCKLLLRILIILIWQSITVPVYAFSSVFSFHHQVSFPKVVVFMLKIVINFFRNKLQQVNSDSSSTLQIIEQSHIF